jgi:FkbM family methyltransferase
LYKVLLVIADQLVQTAKDAKAFGLSVSFKAMRRRFTNKTTDLNLGRFGTITIRPHDSDYTIVRQVFRDRQYDGLPESVHTDLRKTCEALVQSGRAPVIVDGGANIGLASIWFATAFPAAKIVAVEPERGNLAILRRNVSGNRQIEIREAALGAETGFVAVVSEGSSATVTTERATEGCPVITIDDAVASVPNGVPFIVKIDIEGFEQDLFGSNLDWIDRTGVIFIEPHDWRFADRVTSESFQRAMGARRFALYISGENLVYVNRESQAVFR